MKVEHVSNWSETNFYKRLVQVLANEKIEISSYDNPMKQLVKNVLELHYVWQEILRGIWTLMIMQYCLKIKEVAE